jgi:ABC-type glycerol-3-phosphate transport system substrate-binding protein
VYCLGSYTGAVVLLYDKDKFDAAGLEYPSATEPITVDQYAELAAKLTVPNADISQQVWGGTAGAPYWWMSRTDFISEDGRTVDGLINDEPTIHAYEELANMIAQGNAPSESIMQSLGAQTGGDLFLQGKLAMSIGDFADISKLEDAGINYGVATLPVEKAGDAPYLPMWTDSFAVFSGSDHPEEAQEFVTFLATEGQRLRVEVTGQPPLSAKAAEEYGWVDQGNTEARHEFLEVVGSGSPLIFVPGFGDVTAPLSDAFSQIAGGEVAAADALNDVAPRMQESLDQAWQTWEQLGG